MPRRKQSTGECSYCGQVLAKSAMTKHLPKCPQRLQVIAQAEQKQGRRETLYHLRVREPYGEFWLDLEMRGTARLKDLDDYLRAIWLECCGHMSQFSVGGFGSREIGMQRTIAEVFQPDVELTHIYDFGTSSETLIKMVAVREGVPTTPRPIALMARNRIPEAACQECGQPATHLCIECMYEMEAGSATLCDEHTRTHPHDEYGDPIELVNSPRLGACGYTGPAEPPY
ncbi:MAG: hypothetical protein HY231_16380 [Acidobacteria bacterium]|nr:hypothetical protein [Acidobacteriota bacterium]